MARKVLAWTVSPTTPALEQRSPFRRLGGKPILEFANRCATVLPSRGHDEVRALRRFLFCKRPHESSQTQAQHGFLQRVETAREGREQALRGLRQRKPLG